MGLDVGADGALQRRLHHLGETLVAIENEPIRSHCNGAFPHPLHVYAIRLLRAREAVNLVSVGTRNDYRIHLAIADRLEGILSFPQAVMEAGKVVCMDPAATRGLRGRGCHLPLPSTRLLRRAGFAVFISFGFEAVFFTAPSISC